MLPLKDILEISGILAGALALGFLVELLLLPFLARYAGKRNWRLWAIISGSLKFVIVLWFFTLALKFIEPMIPLKPGWMDMMNKGLHVLIVISITLVIGRIAVGLMRMTSSAGGAAVVPVTTILVNITKIVIGLLGLLVVFHSLGIPVTPMLTALGVGGLAVALALQNTLSNLFSGLQIIVSKQVEIGDYVKLASGEEGQIADINWRVTTLRTAGDNLIIVPNSKFSDSNLTNFSRPEQYTVISIPLTLAHGTDLDLAEKVTLDAIKDFIASQKVPLKTQPDVSYSEITETGIKMMILVSANDYPEQRRMRHRMIKTVSAAFRANGIRLADKEIVK